MADQVEVPKLVSTFVDGPLKDSIAVPKLVMYVLMVPGEGGENTGQGHVHTRFITRRT